MLLSLPVTFKESLVSNTNLPLIGTKASETGTIPFFIISVSVLDLICFKVTVAVAVPTFVTWAYRTTAVYPVGAV